MAVGVPTAGTANGQTGGAVNPTLPAGIAADDTIVGWAIFYANSGTVPTAITWPAGFAEGASAVVKNASGTAIGIAGWAWKRADGTESGQLSISANGSNGPQCSSLGNFAKISGCTTTGDPFEDQQVNAPNFVTAVNWPAATMARSTGGLSLILFLNSDNNNVA